MAIFLTVAILEILLGEMTFGPELVGFLVLQVTVGIAAGVIVGRAGVLFQHHLRRPHRLVITSGAVKRPSRGPARGETAG